MRLSEAYRLLGITPGATVDDVKAAYRKLAFKYHPDINPGSATAAEHFTRINEAYVLIKKHLETGSSSSGRKTFSAETIREEEEARIRRGEKPAGGFSARQEEVLRDILNDPFAKQVFEDIFSKLKRGTDLNTSPSHGPTTHTEKKINVSWGDRSKSFDVGSGVVETVRAWMRRQLDDQQTIHVPARSLIPGTTLRVQIRHRFQGEAKTIEVRLPGDFVVGRPIRLKGMGRRIGPWKGDLYLRLLANPNG